MGPPFRRPGHISCGGSLTSGIIPAGQDRKLLIRSRCGKHERLTVVKLMRVVVVANLLAGREEPTSFARGFVDLLARVLVVSAGHTADRCRPLRGGNGKEESCGEDRVEINHVGDGLRFEVTLN
jgi:hypothetical protein